MRVYNIILLCTYCRVTALADDLSENVVFRAALRHRRHDVDGRIVGGQRLTTAVDLYLLHLGRLGGLRRRCLRQGWRCRLHGRRWRHNDDLLRRLRWRLQVVVRGGGRFSCRYLRKENKLVSVCRAKRGEQSVK